MKKYNIEGGIDFYSELYKSLDVEENKHKTEDDLKLCLISNAPLTDKHVVMQCGHKFNYLPLYLDIKNHKQKYNGMESNVGHLKQDEIRCPYCRKKQKGLLPYYEDLGLPKLNGVNHMCVVIKQHSSSYRPCQFLVPNPQFDQNSDNFVEVSDYANVNCKFFKCGIHGSKIDFNCFKGKYKSGNYEVDYPTPNVIDVKNYCYKHKKLLTKEYKSELLDKAKLEIKKIKEKEKEEKILLKNAEKQIKKLEKKFKNIIDSKKNIINEASKCGDNVVVGLIDISGNTMTSGENYCAQILKTGTKKGGECGCKIFSENMCKRHYNITNKQIISQL